jgi:hypothetical protein
VRDPRLQATRNRICQKEEGPVLQDPERKSRHWRRELLLVDGQWGYVVQWTWKTDVVLIAEGVPKSLSRSHRELERGEEQPHDSEDRPISSRVESVFYRRGSIGTMFATERN